jgi:hypothetical protein
MASAEPLPSIVNLTPHDVHVHVSDAVRRTFPRSGLILRTVNAHEPTHGSLPDGAGYVPTVSVTPQKLDQEGLDILARCSERSVIVSTFAAEAVFRLMMLGKFPDLRLLVPDSGPTSAIRDAGGQIVGVRRFLVYPTHDELIAQLKRNEE